MLTRIEAGRILESFNPTYHTHAENLIDEIMQCDIPPEVYRERSFWQSLEHFLRHPAQGIQPKKSRLTKKVEFQSNTFLGICEHFFNSLVQELPPVIPDEERIANIQKVNERQLAWLTKRLSDSQRSEADCQFEGIKGANKFPENVSSEALQTEMLKLRGYTRTLVPYFRSSGIHKDYGDVDPFEFGVSFYVIDRLIREQHTLIFNQVRCVSRFPNEFPHYLLNAYFPVKIYDPFLFGEQFRLRSAIASNMIHYTHGSPQEQVKLGSPPLAGNSVRKDTRMMDELSGTVVPLFLDYDERNGRNHFLGDENFREDDYAGSIPGIMLETTRGVRRLEEYMLQSC